jgi:hypothetical protein
MLQLLGVAHLHFMQRELLQSEIRQCKWILSKNFRFHLVSTFCYVF